MKIYYSSSKLSITPYQITARLSFTYSGYLSPSKPSPPFPVDQFVLNTGGSDGEKNEENSCGVQPVQRVERVEGRHQDVGGDDLCGFDEDRSARLHTLNSLQTFIVLRDILAWSLGSSP